MPAPQHSNPLSLPPPSDSAVLLFSPPTAMPPRLAEEVHAELTDERHNVPETENAAPSEKQAQLPPPGVRQHARSHHHLRRHAAHCLPSCLPTHSRTIIHVCHHHLSRRRPQCRRQDTTARATCNSPEIWLPVLIEVSPPPHPPPPPPGSFFDNVTDWAAKNPGKAFSLGVSVVGLGLLVGYNAYWVRTQSRLHKWYHTAAERRQVIERIIVASVTTPDAVDELKRLGKGFVRVLVLDPFEPTAIPIFLRSLASTLSHRYPIHIHGDPHASAATHPFVHSVVSFLSLSQFSTLAPLEHVQFLGEYLNATHITPIQIIQALLPLMRNAPSRSRDAIENGKGKKSIVACVPALDACVGLPFLGPSSMSAAATLHVVDVLRREVRVAASTGGAEGMNDVEVVSLEVGQLDIPPFAGKLLLDYDSKEYTSWTPSEKLAYGPAWELTLEGRGRKFQRKAKKVELFVNDLVQIVGHGRTHIWSAFDWLYGGRDAVGSGAMIDLPLSTSSISIDASPPPFEHADTTAPTTTTSTTATSAAAESGLTTTRDDRATHTFMCASCLTLLTLILSTPPLLRLVAECDDVSRIHHYFLHD
ncbi:hypothetical protein F5148DRAFT_1146977 [Russula earlei]|uniref:Uncharacterized protein n=1 Tax=Russula earlei TaxID=71964 RepID=A0ACC0UHJ5_9AGAM|nr:hypothetical protein F5148DRAFT_1146977 [Russula earlei]